MKQFHGVYPAMLTPLTKDETINCTALEKLISLHKGQNAEGFYIGGATGEGLLLDVAQRKVLAEKSCEFIGEGPTKIVHIADMNFKDTIELAKHAQSCGADAISAIPPTYFKYDDEDIFAYYKAIAESVQIPLIIYYTTAANTNISKKLFDRLFEVDNIDGVKWTSSNYYEMILLREAHPDITIFNGPDEMLICGLSAGANGGIGSTYNFMLPTYQGIYQNYKAGRMEEALKLQKKADKIIEACLKYPVIPVCKIILEEMGVDVGYAASPMKKFTQEQRNQIISELAAAGLEI